jgi:hypothetical protein
MISKKILVTFIAIFFVLINTLFFLIPFGKVNVNAQINSIDEIDTLLQDTANSVSGPKVHGITCGQPNSKVAGSCCQSTFTASSEAALDSLFPEFGCIPSILSVPFNIATAPLRGAGHFLGGLGQIVTGDFIEGGKDIIGGAACFATLGLIGCDTSVTKPFCISQVPSALGKIIINNTPIRNLAFFQGVEGSSACVEGAKPTTGDTSDPSCKCVEDDIGLASLCTKYSQKPEEASACLSCVDKKAIWTGFGCFRTDVGNFIQDFMRIIIGAAGGIALICIFYSAYLIQFSAGNPERLKKAREYLTGCIIGLLLIIFSVFILEIIGADILRIPGFG